MNLTNEELTKVYGGISWGIWGVGGVIFTFILGFFEGVMNPIKCGKWGKNEERRINEYIRWD